MLLAKRLKVLLLSVFVQVFYKFVKHYQVKLSLERRASFCPSFGLVKRDNEGMSKMVYERVIIWCSVVINYYKLLAIKQRTKFEQKYRVLDKIYDIIY